MNATSLSTRTSCGSPSTRSAMMLRMISSVPPAMRIPGALISVAWKSAVTIFEKPGLWLTRALVFLDSRGIDGGVNGLAALDNAARRLCQRARIVKPSVCGAELWPALLEAVITTR